MLTFLMVYGCSRCVCEHVGVDAGSQLLFFFGLHYMRPIDKEKEKELKLEEPMKRAK